MTTMEKPLVKLEIERRGWGTWVGCGRLAGEHEFRVNEHFVPHLTEPVHMLVCERCGLHLHATFEVRS